ncbi:hypothetical protein [Actinomyces ruminis]|uniref:hypothetical protein n=1 Tax=Actinomyces ruminis TaxID=1937003 RepID=UPI00211EA6B8|nr:hypothetical protein [Actinomyces ruminis]
MTPSGHADSRRAVVDLDVPGPTISRHIYGHFAEHLAGASTAGSTWARAPPFPISMGYVGM